MDLLAFVVFCSLLVYNEAIKCHDCTSWNPYCRDEVNEPFPDAVATVECEKTNTCFLKKEANGVISRGCTDWWMESQVDIDYVGCQSQTLPWLGKQTWCFCKEDYCNGGTVAMMQAGISPENVRRNLVQGQLGWDSSFEWPQWQDNTNSIREGNVFDDTNPHVSYNDASARNDDPVYKVWWWHADSDRPRFSNKDRSWKAPAWVEQRDGYGWDFPITTRNDDRTRTFAKTTEKWGWGQGWGHIVPWWSGRYTHHHKTRPSTLPTWTTTPATTTAPAVHVVQNEGENSIVDDRDKDDVDVSNSVIDSQIEVAEFFCWDCYSDSPHCGERVNTIKAHYLGKTQCSATNKCFVRRQGDVIYRGCADGWQSSAININYEGCRVQYLWGKPVEWCFCTASLCNGDAMEDIKSIYMQHIHPHPYKDNSTSNSSFSIPTTTTTTTTTDVSGSTATTRVRQPIRRNPFSKPATRKVTTTPSTTTTERKTDEVFSSVEATTTKSPDARTIRYYNHLKPSRNFVHLSTSAESPFAARENPNDTKMFDALIHK